MNIREHFSLKPFNTFKLGGMVRYFAEATTVKELKEAVGFAREKKLPFFILGGGSNILVSDEEYPGLAIKMSVTGIEWRDEGESLVVVAGAGEGWDNLVGECVARDLYGIENLSGIPGTVGAAPIQNIGAYGAELKDVLLWVEAFDTKSGEVKKLAREECEFGYRDSVFKRDDGKHLIVTRVALRLLKQAPLNTGYRDVEQYFSERNISEPSLAEVRAAVIEIRKRKLPDVGTAGTAGSFFKNPVISREHYEDLLKKYPDLPSYPVSETLVKIPLAWVIDKICNLKGFREGDAGIYDQQAIVLVNFGNATSADIKKLSEKIRHAVKEKTGIEIEIEVREI